MNQNKNKRGSARRVAPAIDLSKQKKEDPDQEGHEEPDQELRHTSVFMAGARPAVMWVCVVALSYTFILHPVLAWACVLLGVPPPVPPTTSELWPLVGGLLGIGSLRSLDKLKGVATDRVGGKD